MPTNRPTDIAAARARVERVRQVMLEAGQPLAAEGEPIIPGTIEALALWMGTVITDNPKTLRVMRQQVKWLDDYCLSAAAAAPVARRVQ